MEDGPADLGSPPGGVGGVPLADEVVLADRAVHRESMVRHVAGQGAIGPVNVIGRPGVLDDRQFDGRDHLERDPAHRPDWSGTGDEDRRLSPVPGEDVVGEGAARRPGGGHLLGGQGRLTVKPLAA
jgi:hypothetical protein